MSNQLSLNNPIDLTSPELIDSENTVPEYFFNTYPSESLEYYDPCDLSFPSQSHPCHDFLNSIIIPDFLQDCSCINEFLFRINYIPAHYTVTNLLLDYIYFLENLCFIYSGFYNYSLFQIFAGFQSSQFFYELNQSFNIYIPSYYYYSESFKLSPDSLPIDSLNSCTKEFLNSLL